MLVRFNLSDIRYSLDADFANTVYHFRQVIAQGTIALPDWYNTTSLELDGSFLFASAAVLSVPQYFSGSRHCQSAFYCTVHPDRNRAAARCRCAEAFHPVYPLSPADAVFVRYAGILQHAVFRRRLLQYEGPGSAAPDPAPDGKAGN
jgi:hypothetical protein